MQARTPFGCCVLLVAISLMLRGGYWPLLILSVWVAFGVHEWHHLAKTLVHDPKVLILDEPAAGLDPRARIEFRALLKELREMGKTIFISSHILTELSDICTSVAIMEKGKLVASGSLEEIKSKLQTGIVYRLELLDGADLAIAILQEIADVRNLKTENGSVTFEFSGGRERVPDLLKSLMAKDVKVTGLQEVKVDLESMFMRLTKGEVS